MLSDESTLQQFRMCQKTTGKRFNEKYIIQTMKDPPRQMIWGAMSKSGTAGLYFLSPRTMKNGARYVE